MLQRGKYKIHRLTLKLWPFILYTSHTNFGNREYVVSVDAKCGGYNVSSIIAFSLC